MEFETLPQMVSAIGNRYHNATALNKLHHGHWEARSTESFTEKIRRLTLGLSALGITEKTGVGIIANPSPEWLMIDLAIQINRAISVPLFPNISTDNFGFQVQDGNIQYLFIESDTELDTPIAIKLREFKKVISLSVHTQGSNILYFEELMKLGDEVSAKHPLLYSEMVHRVQPDDIATLIYTSGSTGLPKGVEIKHSNLVSQIKAAGQCFPLIAGEDVVLSCLPLAHVFERMVIYYYLSTGISIYFADDIKRVGDLLKEVKPSCITLVPRILEKVYTKMNQKPSEEKGFKRWLLRKALSHLRNSPARTNSIAERIYDKLVYTKLRDALGGNLKYIISGGAALDTKVNQFFLNAGFPVFEGYGLTEASPVLAANFPGNHKPGTVGIAFPGVELKLSEKGEIIGKGPGIMAGYHNNKKATDEVIDQDGWLHTGDRGEFDAEGFLSITGRIKELHKTSNGKYVSPVPIENALSASSDLIDQSLIIAEGKKFVSILLWPDWENIEKIKKKRGLGQLNNSDFLDHPKVQKEVKSLINRLNKSLNHWEQIRHWIIKKDVLSIEAGDLTPKMNIRRHYLLKKYANDIDEIYKSDENSEE